MLIFVESLGQGPAPSQGTHETCILPDQAKVQVLLHALGRTTEEVMLIFVDGEIATLQTPLYEGAKVTLCTCICGG